jgi:hypothetical protein
MPGILCGCLPAATATSSWLAGRLLGHDAALALGLAGLVGLITLLASAEAQRTIRTWIRHRAETRIAAADAYRIRRQIRAATCGLRWTTANAARIRDTAAALNPDHPSLAEIMRITRHYPPGNRPARSKSPTASRLISSPCEEWPSVSSSNQQARDRTHAAD